MPHAIIRGKGGRRHEVDFGDTPVRVEIYSTEETIEIFIEADFETLPEGRRRFALLNIPRHQFSEAAGTAARRAVKRRTSSSLTFPAAVTVCFSTSEHINFEKYSIVGSVIV